MPFLSLSEETYQALTRIRQPDESNEDVIRRVIEDARCYMVLQGMENTDKRSWNEG